MCFPIATLCPLRPCILAPTTWLDRLHPATIGSMHRPGDLYVDCLLWRSCSCFTIPICFGGLLSASPVLVSRYSIARFVVRYLRVARYYMEVAGGHMYERGRGTMEERSRHSVAQTLPHALVGRTTNCGVHWGQRGLLRGLRRCHGG
jgi:hypothetical protein